MIFLKLRLNRQGEGGFCTILRETLNLHESVKSLLDLLHLLSSIRHNKIVFSTVKKKTNQVILLESKHSLEALVLSLIETAKKSLYGVKVVPLFGSGIGITFTTAEVKVENLAKYTSADILSMLKSMQNHPAPDTSIRCDCCKEVVESKTALVATRISIGEDWKLCDRCRKHMLNCEECGFNEPKGLMIRVTSINDDTGKNILKTVCIKCHKNYYPNPCRNCGSYYQGKECPCKIPGDFKEYIYPHNADVLSYLQKDSYSRELFGIEIEVGTLNKNRRIFRELAEITQDLIQNDAILVYDSSIDFLNKAEGIKNNFKGFEIVTRPMVYKNAIRFVKEFCKSRHPLLKSWEVGTCGLHIHVSKAALRSFEQGKILKFVNNTYNRQFMRMIAKREDKKFAKFLTKKILDYRNNTPIGGGVTKEHYEAINTSKKFTLEFRVFRGTLNATTIVSYLQFVKSLCEFVKVTPQNDLRYTTYLTYLFGTEKSQFRELKERLRTERLQEIKETDEI